MLKNWIWVENPLAPFYNNWFPNPHITAEFERGYRENMSLYSLKSRWEIPLQVTLRGSALGGLLGPVFLLAPLALLSLRRREGRQLLLAALVFSANYFGNIGTRFLIPSLPFVALAMMLALNAAPRAVLAIALLHAAISWPSILRRYSGFGAWTLVKVPVREALRIKPEEGFLESNLPHYGVDRMIERETPPGANILSLTPIPEAYTTRNILVAYQSAENIAAREVLWDSVEKPAAARVAAAAAARKRGIEFLLVIDSDYGAAEFRDHPETWGMRSIGTYKDARLYQLP